VRCSVPILSRFFGITIAMFYQDHQPPHFHARYGADEVLVEIDSGRVEGHMPRRALQMVLEWRTLHMAALQANWQCCLRHEALQPIPPLE